MLFTLGKIEITKIVDRSVDFFKLIQINFDTNEEQQKQCFYHSDHLGSAQPINDEAKKTQRQITGINREL
jgi:hypothetical protein